MSGLDPLGRRDVRALILKLRDRGTTISSAPHPLDAETLCSRVAIVAGGRLATVGRLQDMASVEIRGWEVVMTGVPASLLATLGARGIRATRLRRAGTFELPAGARPEPFVAELGVRRGAAVRLALHTTLEDVSSSRWRRLIARPGAL
jgi:ABC-2 type transport system ATP-binding protein